MPKLAISLLLCFIFSSSYAKLKPQTLSIHFQSGSYKLSPTAISLLDSLAETLDLNDDFEIFLEGHTDNVGHLLFNDSLSSKRVNAVKNFLTNKGIDQELMFTDFFGERNPNRPNTSDQNKLSNRRVELRLVKYHFDKIEELELALTEVDNEYYLDPKETNTIKGRKGVQLDIPSNAFLDKDGNLIEGDVKVTLTEALDLNSFLSHNLTTMSDGRMLESGGMIRITAQSSDGEILVLDPKKGVTIQVPYDQFKEGMEVFSSESGDNWTPTGQSVQSNDIDIMSLMPKLDISEFNYQTLPWFKRDLTTRPSKPEPIGKPKAPRRPDETQYFKPIKWYQWPIKPLIEKRQNKLYTQALLRFDENMTKYRRRKEHYENYNKEYANATSKYLLEYKNWNAIQIEDSLNFTSSEEYQKVANHNKRIKDAILKRKNLLKEEWRRRVDSFMIAMEGRDSLNSTLVNSYVMTYNELSWANIDRFLKYEQDELMPLALKDVDSTGEKTFVIFKDIKSMIPLRKRKDEDTYKTDGIPKKERAVLLAYKVKDGKALVYYEDVSTKKKDYKIHYKPYKLRELKALLKELNG